MSRLIVQQETKVLKELSIGRGTLNIGRHYDNQLQLQDKTVSSHHARIVWLYAPPYIQDLGSTNGTFVNGQRVAQHTLMEGDVIRLGIYQLHFRADMPKPEERELVKQQKELDTLLRNPDGPLEKLRQIGLPSEIHWVAQDQSGIWWGFEQKPEKTAKGWLETSKTNYLKIGQGQAIPNWSQTLREIDLDN